MNTQAALVDDPLGIVRRRLHQQRLAGEPFVSPVEAVGWLGAVQAQEFAEAKWSLAERTRECTDADVEAAFDRGEILRTHVLRPTWHFVTAADIRWLLRLTRPRVHALNKYSYAKFGLDERTLTHGLRLLVEALGEGQPRTRRELAASLRLGGLEAEGLRLGYLLMYAELEELLCSGPRRGKQQTYTLLDLRAPEAEEVPREQALVNLTLRYFRSHGPATVKDFRAWSSLPVAEIKSALGQVEEQLVHCDDRQGTRWYFAADARPGSASHAGAFLVPMYDETIVAYQDLRVVLAYEPPRPGLLDRAIVIDGRTVGSWRRRLDKGGVVVQATLFGDVTDDEVRALEAAGERFGRFLGVPATLETSVAI